MSTAQVVWARGAHGVVVEVFFFFFFFFKYHRTTLAGHGGRSRAWRRTPTHCSRISGAVDSGEWCRVAKVRVDRRFWHGFGGELVSVGGSAMPRRSETV